MTTVDAHLDRLDAPERAEMERICRIIKEMVPGAKEVITYGMPGFKLHGKYLAGYCSFKNHLSLFPAARPIEVMKDRLVGFKLSKGTIQFTVANPLPEEIIKELIQIRITDISGR